ncbi:MAG: hypothetical protein PVF87_09850 [Acidimicrobiia bacterium]|jgi:hypothetical protein
MQRLLVFGVLLALGTASGSVAVVERRSLTVEDHPAAGRPAMLTVYGASDAQDRRLEDALRRFEEADLALPPLAVVFHDDQAPCHDHPGVFLSQPDPWEIHLCSESVEWVYEHELAHAWIEYNLGAQQRQAFMDLGSYETWNDKSYPWNERGTEGAAVVIQQAISGLPLPQVLSDKTKRLHVDGYQLLVGDRSPRFTAWLDKYSDG